MKIDKQQVLDMLRADDQPGDADKADQAEQELPQQVDTDEHQDLLQRFGLDPSDLLSRFAGGLGL